MRVETFTCDECGEQKKDANHWFLFDSGSSNMLTIHAWDREKADREYMKHICGEQCLMARLAGSLGFMGRRG